jgi:hypothetical protein
MKLLTRLILTLACVGMLMSPIVGRGQAAPLADWTIMVFMDGDNNLELASLHDFDEMADVGSTDKVNIVVQLDRIGKYTVGAVDRQRRPYEYWDETLRYRITRGMKPSRAAAIKDATCTTSPGRPQVCPELNMGDPQVLTDFISWAKTQYPAKHYMLVIWDHGQGYRDLILDTATNRAAFRTDSPPATEQAQEQVRRGQAVMGAPFRAALGSPYRTASHDETNQDQLYNIEIQQGVRNGVGGRKLDILGFDACLMAMVETAYAMRDQADVMVGSEDLEPGAGWLYNDWLQKLVNKPSMDSVELAKLLVESYKNQYDSTTGTTTQSAVHLTQADALAQAISSLADSMRAKMDAEAQNIKAARDECDTFAPNPFEEPTPKDYFFHIDFIRFCDRLIAHTADPQIRQKAQTARDLAAASVIATYAGRNRQGRYGANGLAIYFPASGSIYKSDQYAQGGYEKSNTLFPVEFVQRHTWADFLQEYFRQFP